VRFRDDILRGLRRGAVLLSLLIAGVVAYRMAPDIRAALTDKGGTAKENAKPAATRGPDPRFMAGSSVPPPPPAAGGRKAVRRAAPVIAPPVETADQPFENPPASESVIREAPVETAAPLPAPVQEKIVESPAPVVPVAKPEARPKRWARAVGRFLHIVHPPNN
jgi:hypothetical protein